MQPMQSRIGKKYNYFGKKPKNPRSHHPDSKWDANDKIDQYKCIEKIFRLHYELERAKHESEFKQKKLLLAELEYQVKEKQLKLSDLKTGEYQKVKNLLKERKEPISAEKPSQQILEDCKCKLFDKRKQLDRLRYEQEQLCKLYSERIIYLAEMQDREKYVGPHQNAEEMKVKRLEYLLENSGIRIQTYENFLAHCESVVSNLTEESFHYENTLNSLEREVNEQNNILASINKLGMPAYESSLKNKKYLRKMQERSSSAASKRQATLTSYKRDLLKNEQNIFKHLPKDENFIAIAPTRYIRETPSVTDLRLHCETVENQTKQLCDAASCGETSQLCSTVKDIFMKLKAGEEKVNVLEEKLLEMDKAIENAKHVKNQLCYSVKDEDIDVVKATDDVNREIAADLENRNTIETKTASIEDELFKIQFAMQHLINLLKNVNGKRPMIRKDYPNEVLSLPLHDLHQIDYPPKTIAPETVEEDFDKLFKAIFERVTPLMGEYANVTISDEFSRTCEKHHERLVLQELDEFK